MGSALRLHKTKTCTEPFSSYGLTTNLSASSYITFRAGASLRCQGLTALSFVASVLRISCRGLTAGLWPRTCSIVHAYDTLSWSLESRCQAGTLPKSVLSPPTLNFPLKTNIPPLTVCCRRRIQN
ncbi:hypothetical protein GDO78_002796 [Eleutherodactylus coqui]|uniref:Uncharacterized protein n=1 Tax=Eleutherodactylus coqui TaxID=57060 RepID=A0A8J6EY76_ELECQ|nr:hypothetical protein GDO78_002796 [Eleutherodactylus coqui]